MRQAESEDSDCKAWSLRGLSCTKRAGLAVPHRPVTQQALPLAGRVQYGVGVGGRKRVAVRWGTERAMAGLLMVAPLVRAHPHSRDGWYPVSTARAGFAPPEGPRMGFTVPLPPS